MRVGELDLGWHVGEPRVTARLPGDAGGALTQAIAITLAVERADGSGKKLVAAIRGQRALSVPAAGFRDVQTIAIEPASVRRLVELAAPRGAWPTGTGTIKTEFDLPSRPLPTELAHFADDAALTLVWSK